MQIPGKIMAENRALITWIWNRVMNNFGPNRVWVPLQITSQNWTANL